MLVDFVKTPTVFIFFNLSQLVPGGQLKGHFLKDSFSRDNIIFYCISI